MVRTDDPPGAPPVAPDLDGPDTSEHRMVCAVCSRVLNHHDTDTDGAEPEVEWLHPLDGDGYDHDPVPIPFAPVLADERCDFCHAAAPTMVLPVRPFEMGPGQHNEGDWATCSHCADLIDRGQWSAVQNRAQKEWEQRNGPMPAEVVTSMKRLYRLVRKNVTGTTRPAT